MEGRWSGDIDISIQQVDEIKPKPGQIKESAALFELDEEIHVAFWRVLSPRYGAENASAHHSTAPHQALDLRPKFQERWNHVPILPLTPHFSPFPRTSALLPPHIGHHPTSPFIGMGRTARPRRTRERSTGRGFQAGFSLLTGRLPFRPSFLHTFFVPIKLRTAASPIFKLDRVPGGVSSVDRGPPASMCRPWTRRIG